MVEQQQDSSMVEDLLQQPPPESIPILDDLPLIRGLSTI